MATFHNDRGYVAPALSTDAVVEQGGEVLLIRRARDPGAGQWALPGGFVEAGERVEDACLRELREETGVEGEIRGLVGVYSDPDRDPRGHVVSVVYHVRRTGGTVAGADDADEARWFPVDGLPELAFDHADILADHLRQRGAARGEKGTGRV